MKMNFSKWPPPQKKQTPKKLFMEFSTHIHISHMWKMHTWWLCLSGGTAKVNIGGTCTQLGGGKSWAHNHVYMQVRATCWASLSARWLQCQQAGPGLIKDVGPNRSGQHLLGSHTGGWRRSSTQRAHESDLEESRERPVWKTPKRSGRFLVWHQMDCTHWERKYCCWTTAAICFYPLPPSWINH